MSTDWETESLKEVAISRSRDGGKATCSWESLEFGVEKGRNSYRHKNWGR